ncbi:MAG TPA: TIGR00730 family Rossman fold protein [Myxococcota bacterium]
MRIAVFCGSSQRVAERYRAAAWRVGVELARGGHVLVYGGGRTGLMGAVADGALEEGGTVHGVILDTFVAHDVHHTGIDLLHQVDDMRKRKQGLDERADAFIALPGGLGTLEELAEILSFRKLGLHGRRLVLLNVDGFYDPLVQQIDRFVSDGFDRGDVRDYLAITDDPGTAVALCESAAP